MMKLQLAVLILFFTVIDAYYYANLLSTVSFGAEVQKEHNNKTLNVTQSKKDGELNKFAMSNEKGKYLKATRNVPSSFVRIPIFNARGERLKYENWMEKLALSSSDVVVDILGEISILVREYDTGTEFVKSGYLDFLLELLSHDDPDVVEATLKVLSSAMQGNVIVQKWAWKVNILPYILLVMSRSSTAELEGTITVLSTYLQNSPQDQLYFIASKGIDMLQLSLINPTYSYERKLLVIDLITDLSLEIMHEIEPGDNGEKKLLKRSFIKEIKKNKICEVIPEFLKYDVSQEKTIKAMNALWKICFKHFTSNDIVKSVQRLIQNYSLFLVGTQWASEALTPHLMVELKRLKDNLKYNRTSLHDEL